MTTEAWRSGNLAMIDLPYDVLAGGVVPKERVTVITTHDDILRRMITCVIEAQSAPQVRDGHRIPVKPWTDFYRSATGGEMDKAMSVRLTERGDV